MEPKDITLASSQKETEPQQNETEYPRVFYLTRTHKSTSKKGLQSLVGGVEGSQEHKSRSNNFFQGFIYGVILFCEEWKNTGSKIIKREWVWAQEAGWVQGPKGKSGLVWVVG